MSEELYLYITRLCFVSVYIAVSLTIIAACWFLVLGKPKK